MLLEKLKIRLENKGKQLKYALKKRYTPKYLYVEVTNHCNAKCIMCPHEKMHREKGHMSWELFERIIDECKSFRPGLKRISLAKDGEPLLDPLLFRRIEYVKKVLPGCEVQFNSNAMALDEDKARKLVDSSIDRVNFSVDGASRESYEQIRKGLKYDVVKKNIEKLMELRKGRDITVGMQMVVCDKNRHEIEEYRRLWADKADGLIFKAMHNFLDMGTSIRTEKMEKRQVRFCNQPFKTMLIYWNGDMALCCWDYGNFVKLGNVGESGLLDLYNNSRFKAIRAAMVRMDCSDITPCGRCSQIYGQDMGATRVRSFDMVESNP